MFSIKANNMSFFTPKSIYYYGGWNIRILGFEPYKLFFKSFKNKIIHKKQFMTLKNQFSELVNSKNKTNHKIKPKFFSHPHPHPQPKFVF